MRVRVYAVFLVSLMGLSALAACGGKPKPKDPSDSDTPPASSDETPKWDNSSTTGTGSSSSSSSSSSAGDGTSSSSKAAPPVEEHAKQRSDEYDKEATEVVLKRAARQVKANCGAATDENGKASGPWGKTTIQIALGRNGHSKGVTVPAPYQGKPTGNCVEKAFSNLTFPPWAGADTTVDWEIELAPPGAK